jgi:hypothetical protein
MAIKRYRGIITKGKRKGKQGFITQREFIKQNINSITFDTAELNESESKIYKQILKNEKISAKAKERFRFKGKFLNKEAQKFIKKQLDVLGKPYTQENIDLVMNDEIFFTFRSLEISDVLMNHKGPIQLNGEEFSLEEAIVEFDILNQENYREWADKLDIDEGAIFFIIYDATYKPITKVLNIDTMVNDETRVITSDPKTKANRKAEREAKRKLQNEKANIQSNKQRK